MYGFRVASNTISIVVREVCEAIVQEYADEVMTPPKTPAEWQAIADQFGAQWNFHHAIGALDENTLPYSILRTQAHSTTTTKGSTPSYCWHWWMLTTSSPGWMSVPRDLFQFSISVPQSSTSVSSRTPSETAP